ncbi:MAG TPA: rhomboid family intramembrane serine protease [Candidatus Eisenbacteria bacterium]|nr:rhomboid family intramembrane serine protease [Candidatus Eisenbacteria bacterium]
MVIPLRDIQERQKFPIVNILLIGANLVLFLYELSLGANLEGFLRSSAFIPSRFFLPDNTASDVQTLLLSMFLHGGWAHFLGNMLYLWIFGDNVEDRLGHALYLIFYVLSGVAATLAHAFLSPESTVPAIGASGAISGVLGAYLVIFPRARVITVIPLGFFLRMAELPALAVLGMWFVLQLLSGTASLAAASAQEGGVAWWAHIGGFVFGMILGFFFRGRRPQPRTGWLRA